MSSHPQNGKLHAAITKHTQQLSDVMVPPEMMRQGRKGGRGREIGKSSTGLLGPIFTSASCLERPNQNEQGKERMQKQSPLWACAS